MLEVEADLPGKRAGRHVVRAAERGKEVVQRVLVRQIDHREADAPFVPVAVEQVVVAHREVKQVPRKTLVRIS